MAMKIKTPEFKNGCYERYRIELEAWREITDLAKEKQGIAIALTLPEEDETGIREKVFDELTIADLKAENGLDLLLQFMDRKLKKDDLADSWEKFNDFEEYKRTEQSIAEYISKFDQKYKKMVKKGMTLPAEILAFMLLKRANLSNEERLLVLTGMDYSKKDELYEQAKFSLKKFKGDQVSEMTDNLKTLSTESAFYTNQQHQQYQWSRGRGDQWSRGRGGSRARGNRHRPQQQTPSAGSTRATRRINPKSADGKTLTCVSCGSYRHMLADCPDSWENLAKAKSNTAQNSPEPCLYTGTNSSSPDNTLLRVEASFCAVLDCACSSTVCGASWIQNFLQSLNEEDKKKVEQLPSERSFKFGGGEVLPSIACYKIPAYLAGKKVFIQTDVVESDIPLLLSIKAMKNAGIVLNLVEDSATIFGEVVSLNHTSSGHYCVSISKEINADEVYAVKLSELDDSQRYKTLLKLHRQFAHPSKVKLVSLLKDANIWKSEYDPLLSEIYERCELCKMHPTTPPRPAVALPMASQFNEKVTLDLKKWGDKWILHMIDMWSRLTVSKFITRKRPTDVIDNIMLHWVGTGFGIMSGVLTDNGGEFSADEMREVASVLNVETFTTAAESPFQNGLCERNHAITDSMLLKLIEQCPKTPVDVLLTWANTARNSLQMWHGFSSYQLVFGKNPNIPNVMTDNVAALQGTSSEQLAEHLRALHSARKAFIESESSERIRRALNSKIRVSEQTYERGDRVFYKREAQKKWLGPAKVVFQDGKVIFIRHGGIMVRVSPNRLIKAPEDPSLTPLDPTTYSRGGEFEHPKQTSVPQQQKQQHFVEQQPSATPEDQNTTPPDDERLTPPVQAIHDTVTTPQDTNENDETSSSTDTPTNKEVPHSNKADIVKGSKQRGEIDPSQTTSTKLQSSFPRKNEAITIKEPNSGNWSTVKVIGRAGKATGKHKSWVNVKTDDASTTSIDLESVEWKSAEEVNIVTIPRNQQNNEECQQAKVEELNKLRQFKTFTEVPDKGQFRISTTWVLWDKSGTIRARLVARGYEENCNARTDSPTVSKSGLRTFLAIAAHKEWTAQTTDIKSAFLQGKPLTREVHVTPPKEACVTKGKIWKLNNCLYGLNDAARHFYNSVSDELLRIGCERSALDPAIFFSNVNDSLHGLFICHVDDFLHTGDANFNSKVVGPIRQHYTVGRCEEATFDYVGFHLEQTTEGIMVTQNQYVESISNYEMQPCRRSQKLDKLNPEENKAFRALVGKLNWAAQGCRPDFAFSVVHFSTKFQNTTINDMLSLMKCIKKLKESSSEVFIPKLTSPPDDWRIVVFSDAAHANLTNNTISTSGYIVFLVDKQHHSIPLAWCSNKIKRVVRSSLAAEALSLQSALECAMYHQSIIQELLGKQSVPTIDAIIDSQSLHDAVNSTKLVDDKRLRIDIGAIKQSIELREVNLQWLPGSFQLADCLTKKGSPSNELLHVIRTGCLPIK